jgi:hypothetical protein
VESERLPLRTNGGSVVEKLGCAEGNGAVNLPGCVRG